MTMPNDSLLTDDSAQTDLLPELDPNKNYYQELVGEGRKFKDNEGLAKSKYYADQTIEVMKRRMDELRTDNLQLRENVMTRDSVKEMFDQLSATKTTGENTLNTMDQPSTSPDPKDYEAMIFSKISEYESRKKESDNYSSVKDRLTQQYGDNFPRVLKQRSTELGLSDEDLTSLARKSPSAFFKMLELDKPREDTFQAPIRSNQRNDNFAPSGAKKRTWSYYQELKKSHPEMYFDSKITSQMAKDAVDLGEEFRDGNYYVKGLHEI